MTGAPVGTVDLWPLDLTARRPDDLDLLSPDERVRAASFRFDEHRLRWITGRAAVRRILGEITGRDPVTLTFDYGPYGKASLDLGHGVHFNLSHSGPVGLLAVAGTEVGVDIEHSPSPGASGYDTAVARTVFTEDEIAELDSLPIREQPAAFLRCWTRKEAYVKARGEGLSLPLDAFAVSSRPGDGARILWSVLDRDGETWSMLDVSHVVQPCLGALVVAGSRPSLRVRSADQARA